MLSALHPPTPLQQLSLPRFPSAPWQHLSSLSCHPGSRTGHDTIKPGVPGGATTSPSHRG